MRTDHWWLSSALGGDRVHLQLSVQESLGIPFERGSAGVTCESKFMLLRAQTSLFSPEAFLQGLLLHRRISCRTETKAKDPDPV